MEQLPSMKRSLFSSVLAIVLMAASCGDAGNNEKETQGTQRPSAAKSTEVEAVKSNVQDETPTDTEGAEAQPKRVAPVHGTPDQGKLDSVKNSYPKKK